MAKTTTTLYIKDDSIDLLVLKDRLVERWASMPLESGLISQGQIVDEEQVTNKIKELINLAIEREVFSRKMELLDYARKKTTQKVNLFEKVQIPGYEEAILKIKRFMEDEDNLSKSSQKIVKTRQEAEVVQ